MIHIFSNSVLNSVINLFFGIFSILGVYYTIRKKYSKSLTYVEIEKINLNSSVLKGIDGIKITYNGKKVQDDLYLIRGFLLNTGKADLQKSELQNNLKAKLNEGKWVNCSILSSSDSLKSAHRIENNCLYIEADLLKVDEYIYFEAIAETSEKNIQFSHRIANLGKVKNLSFEKIEKKLFKNILWSIIIGFAFYLFSSSVLSDIRSSYLFNFEHNMLYATDLKLSFPIPKNDTIFTIKKLHSTLYTLGEDTFDSIALSIYSTHNMIDLMYNHPDTVIIYEAGELGDMKVSLNKEAISEINSRIYISIFILILLVLILVRLIRNGKHLYIKKKVLKTTATNSTYV